MVYDFVTGSYVESDPMGQLVYFGLSNRKTSAPIGVRKGYWNHLYAYSDGRPTSLSDPHGLGLIDWLLDFLKDKEPEEASSEAISTVLAQGCIAENCKRRVINRSELEAQGDCLSIINDIVVKKGSGFVAGLQIVGGVASVVATCGKECSEKLKTMGDACGCGKASQ